VYERSKGPGGVMTRAKIIITAFQLLGLLGFFVILSAVNEHARIEENILTALTGVVMVMVARVVCVYIRAIGRKR
jgi:hypothetical protein